MSDYIRYIRKLVGHRKVIMVVAGAFVFDSENRLLLQLRSDNHTWGHPGGFMEFGETVEDTARREVYEETGLYLGNMELFGIYSGPLHEQKLENDDQIALVKIIFSCKEFEGALNSNNKESISLKFFSLNEFPSNLLPSQKYEFDDLLSDCSPPFIK